MTSFLDDLLNESSEGAKEAVRAKLRVQISEALLLLLQQRGMTKSELAASLGVSRSAVTQALTRSRNLSTNLIADIAHALDVEPSVAFAPTASRVAAEANARKEFHRLLGESTPASSAEPSRQVPMHIRAPQTQISVTTNWLGRSYG